MKALRHISSLLLALLMLITATGFSVDAHWCAGELQELAFYEEADACPMELKVQQVPSCHAAAQSEMMTKAEPCCENHAYTLEQHDESVELSTAKNLKPELKLIALAYTFVLPLIQEAVADEVIPETYQLPPIARDIPVLVQSFLL